MRTITKKILFLSLLAIPLLAGSARSEEKVDPKETVGNYRLEGVDVVQGRVFRKAMRHELNAGFGYIFNNTFLHYEFLHFNYTFHFREGLGFEAMYIRAFNQPKALLEDLNNVPCPPPATGTCSVTLPADPDPIQNGYFGNVVWSPIYGKLALFSKKILHFDLFLRAGAGMFDTERNNEFAFNVAGGWKVFINDWMSARLELANYTYREGAPFNHIVNDLELSLGASFFLPPHPKGK